MQKLGVKIGAGILAVYAVVLHILFIRAVPDPLIYPDSISYLRPALSLLFQHHFDLSPVRTPGYPLFLFLILRLRPNFSAVLWMQHGLAIGTMGLTGWIAWRFLKVSPAWAIAAGWCSGIFPLVLLSSHAILTETLYTFLSLLAILFLFRGLEKDQLRDWGWTAVCAAGALLVRPGGWALEFAILAAIGLQGVTHAKTRWRNAALFVSLTALALAPAYAWVYAKHRVVGLTALTGVALFGTTARFLDVSRVPDIRVRQVLAPFYATPQQIQQLEDSNWVRYAKDGPAVRISALFASPAELDHALTVLVLQAIQNHPFHFLGRQITGIFDFIRYRSSVPDIDLDQDFSFFVARGQSLYMSGLADMPASVSLFKYSPETTRMYLNALGQVRQGSDEQAAMALTEAHRRDPYHYEWVLRWMGPLKGFIPLLAWLPAAALMAGLLLLKDPQHRRIVELLLVYMVMHIGLCNLGGDADPRYSVAIEPLYWMLLCAGLSRIAHRPEIGVQF